MSNQSSSTIPRKRIVVLGGGFGGLYTIRDLTRKLRCVWHEVEIILIDQHNYFLFSPLLHEVMVEMVDMHHVVHPLRQSLRGLPVRYHETPVMQINLHEKTVLTGIGEIGYDYLVIALGSITQYFGMEDVQCYSFPLKTMGHAVRLRNHVLSMLESASNASDPAERQRMLTFVQVGAGYTGLETITELRDFVHDCVRKDYPELSPDQLRFMLVDALPAIPVPLHTSLTTCTLDHLCKKEIAVSMRTAVSKAGRGWVEFANGQVVDTYTVIWTAGVSANPVLANLAVPKGSLGRLLVTPSLQLADFPEVFALGDCACCIGDDGKPLPPTAQVVNQQAPVTAENIYRMLYRLPLKTFHFKHLGELASLGEYCAVAELGSVRLSGFVAWLVWRTIYLMKMPWWNDRLRIAIDWMLDFFMRRDTSRIEVGASCSECAIHACDAWKSPERDE